MSIGYSGCFCFGSQETSVRSTWLDLIVKIHFLDRIKSSHGVKKGFILELPDRSPEEKKAVALANQRGRQLYITLLTRLGIMTTPAKQGQELVDFTTLEMDAGVGDLMELLLHLSHVYEGQAVHVKHVRHVSEEPQGTRGPLGD